MRIPSKLPMDLAALAGSPARTPLTAALVVVLGMTLSACGGNDAKATAGPTVHASTSTTPAPTSTPKLTPSPTAKPLSPFESRPQVVALRDWAAASTRDVNERHHDFRLARQFEVDTAKVRSDVAESWHEDFDKYYPGPLPFTPIALSGSRRRSVVTVCAIGSGFALTRPGGKRAEERHVIPVDFTMAEQRGTWLLAGIVAGTADCAGVQVREVKW